MQRREDSRQVHANRIKIVRRARQTGRAQKMRLVTRGRSQTAIRPVCSWRKCASTRATGQSHNRVGELTRERAHAKREKKRRWTLLCRRLKPVVVSAFRRPVHFNAENTQFISSVRTDCEATRPELLITKTCEFDYAMLDDNPNASCIAGLGMHFARANNQNWMEWMFFSCIVYVCYNVH